MNKCLQSASHHYWLRLKIISHHPLYYYTIPKWHQYATTWPSWQDLLYIKHKTVIIGAVWTVQSHDTVPLVKCYCFLQKTPSALGHILHSTRTDTVRWHTRSHVTVQPCLKNIRFEPSSILVLFVVLVYRGSSFSLWGQQANPHSYSTAFGTSVCGFEHCPWWPSSYKSLELELSKKPKILPRQLNWAYICLRREALLF